MSARNQYSGLSSEERFFEKVAAGPNGCHIWTANRDDNGYGRFKDHGVWDRAYRWAYAHAYGAVPAGLDVDHTCRNRACVNPLHLEAVSHGENIRRGASAKLTWPLVTQIRERCAAGESQASVARDLGVDKTCVNKVMRGRSWAPVAQSDG